MSTRRRRERSRSKKEEQSWLTPKVLWIVGGVLAVIILTPVVMGLIDGDGDIPDALAEEVDEYPDEGRDHVQEGTEVEYETEPPTSGAHYPRWANAEIFREPVQDELLVHNLEHGHVIFNYNPERLSDEAATKITELNEQYNSEWEAVLAVPRQDQEEELVLTAWTKMLRLDEYDEELVDQFVDAYRGRGPENPVR